MRVGGEAARGDIERRELHVDDNVVPGWNSPVIARQARRGSLCLTRAERAGEESLERVAPHKKIDRSIGAVFGVSNDRLLDHLDAGTHCLKRLDRRLQA